MANNELGIRFTEDKYATKNEVAKELRITAIDSFWSNILAYRAQFKRYLNLKSVDKELFSLCGCSSINALINNAENKLLCLNREFCRIYADNNTLSNTKEMMINRIGRSTNSLDYADLLRYASKSYNALDTGEDYLADLFSKLNHITEITHFYRTDDSVTKEKTALVDRIYKCAPSALIDSMMNDLFAFIKDKSLSSITKFALVYLYMVYVRPFDANYKELAMAYAKSVLAKDSLGELAFLIPFEDLLFNDATMDSLIAETQRALDVTYFVKFLLDQFIDSIDGEIEKYKNISCSPTQVTVQSQPAKPIMQNVSVPKPVIVSEEPVVENVTKPIYIAKAKVNVTDKESTTVLNKIENELLERDPNLKRKEAHFYSRHREIGKSYSIADYKRFSRCVYETARTSMDHLAELGYYKKIQIKNKFVYETIER